MRKLVYGMLFLFNFAVVNAEVIEIQNIEQTLPFLEEPNTLVLWDMEDVLIDSTLMIGTGAWRKSLRDDNSVHGKFLKEMDLLKLRDEAHNLLTIIVAGSIPVKPVEPVLPGIVEAVQQRNPTFVLTQRAIDQWYSTPFREVDALTDRQLKTAGYDFKKSILPPEWSALDPASFKNGVFYAGAVKKGPFLKALIEKTGYRPAKIVFINDKRDQVTGVEKAAEELGIPYVGIVYLHCEIAHANYSDGAADLQLKYLTHDKIKLSDEQALQKWELLKNGDPEMEKEYARLFSMSERLRSHRRLRSGSPNL